MGRQDFALNFHETEDKESVFIPECRCKSLRTERLGESGVRVRTGLPWVRCPGSDQILVSPVRTEHDGPQWRLGES